MAIPTDVDEFIIPYRDNKPVADKQLLLDTINQFIASGESCWNLEQAFLSLNFYVNDTVGESGVFDHSSVFLQSFTLSLHCLKGNISMLKRHYEMAADVSKKIAIRDRLKSFHHGFHLVELIDDQGNSSNGNCSSGINKLGMLHYHNRNPIVTATRAVNDISGFGYFDRSVTLQTVHRYRRFFEKFLKKGKVTAHHKMEELLVYIYKGPEGLLHNPKNFIMDESDQRNDSNLMRVVHIEPLDSILKKFKALPPV